jgi:arylsulfatase
MIHELNINGQESKNLFIIILFLYISCSFSSCTNEKAVQVRDDRPNILLLVADDLGYADLSCYGSDIETPNIDQLAKEGIRFSRFHTSPYCAPTRAMLLSGNDNHIAGMGRQGLRNSEFGYEGMLTDRIVTIPALLRETGYHTYVAGKWHLGITPDANPHQKGFEHSFALLLGAGNHYNDQGLFPEYPVSPYTEDGKEVKWKDGDYSTDFYTDKLIEYIGRHKDDGKPFFAFAAYTSPHWPLQVDEKFWRKYQGRYDDGYEKLKEKRLESLKKAGMIPEDALLPPNHEKVTPWDSLSPDEQKKEARKMELYAGMVDNLDHNIGRLLKYLHDIGRYDNTLIVFMSDNGAAAEDFYYHPYYAPLLKKHFNDDYENMGNPDSYISYGPQWAEAGSAPFKYFKGFTTEGGMVAPMIISGIGIERKNEISAEFVTLMDIAPTFYEAANVIYPQEFKGKTIYPLKGSSLMSFASGTQERIHNENYIYGVEHGNRAMIRKGDWKIVNIRLPFDTANFELYYIPNDLAEKNNLKFSEPDIYQELLGEWYTFSNEVKVQIPVPSGD